MFCLRFHMIFEYRLKSQFDHYRLWPTVQFLRTVVSLDCETGFTSNEVQLTSFCPSSFLGKKSALVSAFFPFWGCKRNNSSSFSLLRKYRKSIGTMSSRRSTSSRDDKETEIRQLERRLAALKAETGATKDETRSKSATVGSRTAASSAR